MVELHNIFQSRKNLIKKEIEKQKIIVDYRERNSMIAAKLIKHDLDLEFKQLPIGDYIIKDVVIERKTVQDFLSSMLSQRLRKQLLELGQFPKRLLLIEGLEERELYNDKFLSGINPNAIRGFILSILLNY